MIRYRLDVATVTSYCRDIVKFQTQDLGLSLFPGKTERQKSLSWTHQTEPELQRLAHHLLDLPVLGQPLVPVLGVVDELLDLSVQRVEEPLALLVLAAQTRE